MKKKDELENVCHCMDKEECTCTENCGCGCDCDCDCGCDCDCDCGCHEFEPLEEKLLLIGKKDDFQTKEAIKLLDKQKLEYHFLDLDDDKEVLSKLTDAPEIPTLVVVQTIVADVCSGLDEIKETLS